MRVVFTITLLLLSGVEIVSAQNNGPVCRTESLAFRCPAGFTILRSGDVDGLFVARQPSLPGVSLFAVEIGNESADEKLKDVLDKVFQLLYSRRLTDFQFKESKESRHVPDWRYSNFEEKRYQKVAFDATRSEMLHLHVVVISADGKGIMAGFVRTMFKGNDAKFFFEGWTMGSGSGPSELRTLINSITREENNGERRRRPAPAAALSKP